MNNSILAHTGLLTFSTIDALLSRFKYVSQELDLRFPVYKRIITVMIESLENVYKYSDVYESFVKERSEFMPDFEITQNVQSIRLITRNPVKNEDVPRLKKKIDQVNDKNRDELKSMYLEIITNGEFSAKGGAGLGFVEMAKTSGNNLEYSFKPITDDYSLYTFIVTFAI